VSLLGRKDMQLVYLTPQIALDERIDEIADLVRQHYGLVELGDPSTSTDVSLVVQFLRYPLNSLRKRSLLSVVLLSTQRPLLAQ
jgi:hypothetical protein